MAAKAAFVILLLTIACHHALARHNVVGVPPQFNSQQDDVVVFESNADGSNADLRLSCNVTGTPKPIVTWFMGEQPVDRELITDEGSLLIPNITEGEYASRTGVTYHCEATNIIGMTNITATIRSRDISVTYAFFNGFTNNDVTMVIIPAAPQNTDTPSLSIDVALECDVLDANPPPVIEWFKRSVANNHDADPSDRIAEVTDSNAVRFLEGGRYLYMRDLTDALLTETYYCAVTNALIHQTTASGTGYSFNVTGLDDSTKYEYKPIGNVTAFVGEMDIEISYVAAAIGTGDVSCDFFVDNTEINDLGAVGTIAEIMLPTSGNVLALSCISSGRIEATGTLTVFERVAITTTPESNREAVVGGGIIMFSCPFTGIPTPTLSWFFNGQVITTGSGVNIQDDSLTIAAPQVGNSGVYQCFVENSVSEEITSWVLEVIEPEAPQVLPFNLTQLNATNDRRVGTLLVRELESVVVLSVYVAADPCPNIPVWSFSGAVITAGDSYSFSNPCTDLSASSPFLYTLTVNNLTSETSGEYSANFSNLAGQTTLPKTYITIPVPTNTTITGLTLEVVDEPDASCLLNDSTVILTCQTDGFPRPNIVFQLGPAIVTPGGGSFERYSTLFSDQISISSVQSVDAGSYTCVQVETDVSSSAVQFDFCTKPVILDSDTSDNTFVGDELFVQCQVGGIPDPAVTWSKDGADLVDNSPSLRIITVGTNQDISRVEVDSAQQANAGMYTCTATNAAGSASMVFMVDVNDGKIGSLTIEQIIGIAAGCAGGLLLIVLVILLLVCVYMCARKSKRGGADLPYNVSGGKMYTDYSADGRGNVDRDSDEEDGGQPEAFNPEYESLPALRPAQPPIYKPTPSYPHGAPLSGDDMEMVKVPPPDTDSFVGVPPYRKDNGMPDYRPSPDDFLSEDAQFV